MTIGTDECLTNSSGSCPDDHQCNNADSNFQCTCLDGYTYVSNDSDICIGKK